MTAYGAVDYRVRLGDPEFVAEREGIEIWQESLHRRPIGSGKVAANRSCDPVVTEEGDRIECILEDLD